MLAENVEVLLSDRTITYFGLFLLSTSETRIILTVKFDRCHRFSAQSRIDLSLKDACLRSLARALLAFMISMCLDNIRVFPHLGWLVFALRSATDFLGRKNVGKPLGRNPCCGVI